MTAETALTFPLLALILTIMYYVLRYLFLLEDSDDVFAKIDL